LIIIIEAMVPRHRITNKQYSNNQKYFSPGVLLLHHFALHSGFRCSAHI
jgi:hypothetical protein